MKKDRIRNRCLFWVRSFLFSPRIAFPGLQIPGRKWYNERESCGEGFFKEGPVIDIEKEKAT